MPIQPHLIRGIHLSGLTPRPSQPCSARSADGPYRPLPAWDRCADEWERAL
jgi:hypothetical protein